MDGLDLFTNDSGSAVLGFRDKCEDRQSVRFETASLDQSPKPLQNSKAANGMERGQNHKKETPTEIGAFRYCWQLGSEH